MALAMDHRTIILENRALDDRFSRKQWGGKLAAAGHLISAARLDDPRPSLVGTDGSVAVTSETPGAGVSGFFMIQARDEGEALTLARDSPHLKYGGRIEVRRLVGRP